MLVQGWITLLPLRKSVEQHSWLITTMAVSIVISAAILIIQGPWAADVGSVLPSIHFLGMETPAPYFAVPVLMLLWYFGLNLFYRRTIAGLAMSALSQDIDAARTEFEAMGKRILGPTRIGAHGTPIFFVHPKDMAGVLTEIMESPR